MEISEKEFAVIREISNNHLPDQRAIAHRTGISLGLTNLIIKRLIKQGYVKAKQLDRKKIQYILTAKGFSEKAKKSYNFTLKTIGVLKQFREKLQERILEESKKGDREFILSGTDELSDIVELAFKNMNNNAIKLTRTYLDASGENKTELTVHTKENDYTIDIISVMVESGFFY
jgi:DNA-binding MarR family transcriptional regulator